MSNLRHRKTLGNAIKKELWYALDDLAKETEINKSKLLDKAIYHLVAEIHNRPDLIEKHKRRLDEDEA